MTMGVGDIFPILCRAILLNPNIKQIHSQSNSFSFSCSVSSIIIFKEIWTNYNSTSKSVISDAVVATTWWEIDSVNAELCIWAKMFDHALVRNRNWYLHVIDWIWVSIFYIVQTQSWKQFVIIYFILCLNSC